MTQRNFTQLFCYCYCSAEFALSEYARGSRHGCLYVAGTNPGQATPSQRPIFISGCCLRVVNKRPPLSRLIYGDSNSTCARAANTITRERPNYFTGCGAGGDDGTGKRSKGAFWEYTGVC